MGREELPGLTEEILGRAARRTTIKITLGDGNFLRLSTADTPIGEEFYLGVLAPDSALTIDMSKPIDGIYLKIANKTGELGQNLINTPDVLQGAKAVLGCYFYDPITGGEWHDVKLSGTIKTEPIDGDWIQTLFRTKASTAIYTGVIIADAFPDSEVPVEELPAQPAPVYNDILSTPVEISDAFGSYDPYFNNFKSGRYVMPELMLLD